MAVRELAAVAAQRAAPAMRYLNNPRGQRLGQYRLTGDRVLNVGQVHFRMSIDSRQYFQPMT